MNDDCVPGQLNLCYEIEAKWIKFVLLAPTHVDCLNYLSCFNVSMSLLFVLPPALVSTMMNAGGALFDFFNNSPKRQQCLMAKIKELSPDKNQRVLIDVCKTRWISRIDGIYRIAEILPAIISLLEAITEYWSTSGIL